MRINIRAFGELLEVLGMHSAIELEDGESLGSLATKLAEKTGRNFEPRSPGGSNLTILINGRNVRTLKGFETTLREGDTVAFIPLVVGG